MGFNTQPGDARLQQILKRQQSPGFGKDYIPAILATREEAPSHSRPMQISSEKMQRALHALSEGESNLIVMGLYCPKVFDLNEQRMLACQSVPHPLSEHPKARHLSLSSTRGTLTIAEELKALKIHPTVSVPDPEAEGKMMRVPFPFIGDLLWFLEDEIGPYCVNWTIKGSREEFEIKKRFGLPINPKSSATRDSWKAAMRHGIEEVYHRDFDIRTQRITSNDYSHDVARNLKQIYDWAERPMALSVDIQQRILQWLQTALVSGISPLQMCTELAGEPFVNFYDVKLVMYRAIWERKLRVDLFQPMPFDQPLLPEKWDILEVYGSWFER